MNSFYQVVNHLAMPMRSIQIRSKNIRCPPKRKSSDVCCICCQTISAKDEALFCVGRCQKRLHRYCGSVSEQQYKALCEHNISFLCPSCYREQHEGEVKELKGEVEVLKTELQQLKDLLCDVQERMKHCDPVSIPSGSSGNSSSSMHWNSAWDKTADCCSR